MNLKSLFEKNKTEFTLTVLLFAVLIVWALSLFQLANQFPSLFEAQAKTFVIGQWVLLSIVILVFFFLRKQSEKLQIKFIEENWSGLLLACIFFSIYFLFVSIFNQPEFDVDDIFFDSDAFLWRRRFATELVRDYYFRPVHPFVLIIIRPLVWLISIFLQGNTVYATFVLTAFAGALCVFLVWYFIKHFVTNRLYTLLIASLFGASTAQLVFSSLIETYIFLAAVALLFIVFLIKDKPLFVLVITGLVAFGITISNFGQTVIAHFFIKRNIKQIIIYGLLVTAFIVPLTLLHNFVYPDSQPYFWNLSSFDGEGHNQFPPTVQRANFLARVMILNSIAAPEPLILQEEIPFRKVWMFRASIKKDPMRLANYETLLQNITAYTWVGFVLLGGFLFLKNIRKQDNRYHITFIIILLFNFALHMRYGKDVFLYSVNWTYALILFLALAWKEFSDTRWFQISLLAFIILLFINNSQLILTMLSTSALHIK
ncbi:MAG: hypothetical protein JNK81_03625 [Anaerolineales bacterium]|nr:hypothetical protein [Anaerolineales bacterium]